MNGLLSLGIRPLRRMAAVIALALLSACAAPGAGDQTLYGHLGSRQGIENIVDGTLKIVLADPRIKDSFKHSNMKRVQRTLVEQFCVLSDGPCVYSGDAMKEVHQGLDITNAGFNALAEDLQTAMEQLDIPSRYQNKLMAKLAPMQRDIVTK